MSDIDILMRQIGSECLAGGELKALMGARETHVLSAALLESTKEDVFFAAFTSGEDEQSAPLIKALGKITLEIKKIAKACDCGK